MAGFDTVAPEALDLKSIMAKANHLGGKLADVALGELRRQLTYKAQDRVTTLVVVGRFYPSSKTCSQCGTVRAKLSLYARVFECYTCGLVLDRDVNAARGFGFLWSSVHRLGAPLRAESDHYPGQ
jgi:putative transposase